MLFMLDLMQLACERVGVAGSLKWKCRRRSPKCRRRSPPSPLPPGLAVRSVAGKRTAGLGPAGKAEAERMASREENVGVGGVARSGSAVGDDTDGVDGNVVISWPGCTEERVEDVLSVRRTVSARRRQEPNLDQAAETDRHRQELLVIWIGKRREEEEASTQRPAS